MKTQYISTKLIVAVLLMCLTMFVPGSLAASSGIPVGSYSITVTLADVPPDFPPEVADIIVGTWVTEFAEDGTVSTRKNGDLVVYGTYTSSKFHLVIRDKGGPLACTDAHGIGTGVYTWSLDHGELTLIPVVNDASDECLY